MELCVCACVLFTQKQLNCHHKILNMHSSTSQCMFKYVINLLST